MCVCVCLEEETRNNHLGLQLLYVLGQTPSDLRRKRPIKVNPGLFLPLLVEGSGLSDPRLFNGLRSSPVPLLTSASSLLGLSDQETWAGVGAGQETGCD